MADWKFVVVRHFGTAAQRRMTCSRIKQAVEQKGASPQVPLVKYELGRFGEYYLGLAVNIPSGGNDPLPQVVQDVLTGANIRVGQAIWPVDAAGITGLLRGSLECESFTIPIAYERERSPEPIDWTRVVQEADGDPDVSSGDIEPTPGAEFDRLFCWCSAIGSGDGSRFADACRSLGIVDPRDGTWSVLRRLVLLGHLEYVIDGGLRWAVTEPTLVERAGADGEHYLAGQRSAEFVASVSQQAAVSHDAQPDAPRRISARMAPNQETIQWSGRPIRSVGCASLTLANRLPTMNEWATRLPHWEERDFGRYQVERYCPDQEAFVPQRPFNVSVAGLHRFRMDVGGRMTTTLAFYDVDSVRWHCGDFYGLRFLARMRSTSCQALWRSGSGELVIPVRDRWPMPYERALVLASGLLPRRLSTATDGAFLAYPDITKELAGRLCALLGLELKVTDE